MFNKNQTYEQHDNEKISFYSSTIENLNSKDEYRSIPRMIHQPTIKDANDS